MDGLGGKTLWVAVRREHRGTIIYEDEFMFIFLRNLSIWFGMIRDSPVAACSTHAPPRRLEWQELDRRLLDRGGVEFHQVKHLLRQADGDREAERLGLFRGEGVVMRPCPRGEFVGQRLRLGA